DCFQRRRVVWAERLLFPCQRPLVHGLCLGELPLTPIESAQVVDCVQRRGVVWAERLLFPCQRPLVHGLCLGELPLVRVEIAQVVKSVQVRNIIYFIWMKAENLPFM